MSIKGLLYFDMELKYRSRSFLLQSGAKILIKGLLYFNLELLKCWSRASLLWFGIEMLIKVISTSIWICWNGDQRSSLPQPRLLKCWSKVFSTLIWNVASKKSKFGARLFNYESFFIPLFFWDVWFSFVPSWFESLSRKV